MALFRAVGDSEAGEEAKASPLFKQSIAFKI